MRYTERLQQLLSEAELNLAYHEAGHFVVTHLLIADASANFLITGLHIASGDQIRGAVATSLTGTLQRDHVISTLLAGIIAQAYHQYTLIPVAFRGDVFSEVKELAFNLSAAGTSDLRKIAWICRHFPGASFEPDGMILSILKEDPPYNDGYPDLPPDVWDQHFAGTFAKIHQHWLGLSSVAELLATKLTLDPEAALAAFRNGSNGTAARPE